MDWIGRFNRDEQTGPTGWTESIVAAVIPDRRSDAELEIPPLPVPDLGPVADGSSAFSMGRIDRSGRIAARSVLDRLGWSRHDRLSLTTVRYRRDPPDPSRRHRHVARARLPRDSIQSQGTLWH